MTSKTKNIVLIIGFVLAIVICYKLGFSKTMALKKEHVELKKQTNLFENAPQQLSILKQKQAHYDSILLKYQLVGSSIQNSLLKIINSFSADNNLKVSGFLEPHLSTVNGMPVKTYQFRLVGSYSDITQLIYQLEQQTKFGEIINVHFEKKKNYKSGRFFLEAFVLLRSFR